MVIGWCHHAGCGSIGVFYHRKAGSESKIAGQMLCFTIETVVGGREGRRFRTGGSQGLRRCAKCIERVANRIVMLVSRWLWVAVLRRCARGKCMHRGANHIVRAASKVALGSRFAALC